MIGFRLEALLVIQSFQGIWKSVVFNGGLCDVARTVKAERIKIHILRTILKN